MLRTLNKFEEKKVKFYILGNGILDGIYLEEYYLSWGLVDDGENKFFIKFHESNDNNFILGFEQYPWTKYQTKFQAIDLQGNMSAPISVTSMIKQADPYSLQLGWYTYGNINDTINIVILGRKLPSEVEKNKIAKDWSAIIELICTR